MTESCADRKSSFLHDVSTSFLSAGPIPSILTGAVFTAPSLFVTFEEALAEFGARSRSRSLKSQSPLSATSKFHLKALKLKGNIVQEHLPKCFLEAQ